MLRIGKADLYFTLWDVTSNEQYGTDLNGNPYLQYIHTNYTYYQNLSMDESKAVQKAKDKGVTNLEPDEELRGRNRSWKSTKTFDEPKVENVFTFGKYSGELFMENEDVDYMKWYYDNGTFVSENSKETMKNRILELDSEKYVWYNDELMERELMETLMEVDTKKEFIKANGYVDVFVDRNVDGYDHTLYADGIWFRFDEVKENYYNGYSYFLPMMNGKGKRIKNKNVRMFISKEAGENSPFDYEVSSFEIIKK